MSLPLRFKAVLRNNGGKVSDDFWSASYFVEGLDLVSEMMPENENIIICQSTGLTDSKGKEVFFGDVLVNVTHNTGIWEMKFHDLSAAFHLYNAEADENDISFKVRDMIVIGNRWQPIETLKQKAKELTHEH